MKILEEYGIEEDPRLKIAFREMLMTFGLCIVYTLVTLAMDWSIGMSKPPQEYSYILGYPAWFFLGIIVCPLVFFSVIVFLVTRVFKDMSLEPWTAEKKGKEGK
jgi:uncharacterized membrane protein YhdT